MKKTIFCTLLLVSTLGIHTLTAQNKNELKVGYGVVSGTEIGASIGSVLGTAIGASIGLAVGDVVSVLVSGVPTNVTITKIEQDATFWGTFYVGYNHYVTKRWSIGVQGNYNPIRIGNKVYYSNGTSSSVGAERYDFLSLYARTDFNYVARPKFQLYSGILAGGMIDLSRTSDGINFAPHVTILGFRFGQKSALNVEFGMGLGPFISAGYSARF